MYLVADIFGRMMYVREVIEYQTDDAGNTEAWVNVGGLTAIIPIDRLEVTNVRFSG